MTDGAESTEPAEPREQSSVMSSYVVSSVFEGILAAVHEGRLQPGDRLSDADVALEYGVSRTPVREAFQRLREIGIIEAAASRFTRIAIISPRQTADAMVVWLALYGALVVEVIDRVTPEVVQAMASDYEEFTVSLASLDAQRIATTNANFFTHLPLLSENPTLQRSITSVVHMIRLGSLHLPEFIDVRALAKSQELLLFAARDHDRAAALGSLRMLGLISVPLDEITP